VRDAGGNLIANTQVGIRISIHRTTPGGTIVYQETHLPTTNQFGLINLKAGTGTVISGDFTTINWGKDTYYQQTELDPNGSTGGLTYTDMGTTQLISVPYALHSENTRLVRAESSFGNLAVGLTDYNLSGSNNLAVGFNSLKSNTSGYENIAVGSNTLFNNTTGTNNIAIGKNAMIYNSVGISNTAIGGEALFANTTGDFSTATGSGALYSNTTGGNNTANGYHALYSNTTGSYNTAIGHSALKSNTEGAYNTAHGSYALHSNTTGINNTANGYSALYENTTGNYNIANGINALFENTTGEYNTASGYFALNLNTTGDANTANGHSALDNNTTGNFNTCVGEDANTSTGTLDGAAAFGSDAVTNANDKIVIGKSAGMTIGGYANWSNLSDGRFKNNVNENVPGLAFVTQLQPVTYTIDLNKLQRHITAQMPDSIAARYMPTPEEIAASNTEIRTGFIAQDVETAAKKLGYVFDGVNAPTNPTDNYSIEYAGFVPSLVKAVQEQQSTIQQQQQQIDALLKRIESLEKTHK